MKNGVSDHALEGCCQWYENSSLQDGALATRLVPAATDPLRLLRRVEIKDGKIVLHLSVALKREIEDRLETGEKLATLNRKASVLSRSSADIVDRGICPFVRSAARDNGLAICPTGR